MFLSPEFWIKKEASKLGRMLKILYLYSVIIKDIVQIYEHSNPRQSY